MNQRTVFFVSDQTGVTAETLGHSLLTQFDGQEFRQVTVPFIDSVDKAMAAVQRINAVGQREGVRPIIFSTLVQDDLRQALRQADALFLDFFEAFVGPMELELGIESSHKEGKAHGVVDVASYMRRIEATNFAMSHDDGGAARNYERADVILLGVSRSGKTPTCLYLALQYGVFAANYPLTEEDLEHGSVPEILKPHRPKLYGLTIAPDRLQHIRRERRPHGRYASPQQVGFELRAAMSLYRRHSIPFIDTTDKSIEEIAAAILNDTGVERRVR
jgi:regulator of PEP synthase PpsR (kinase-PPPase family)